MLIVALCIYVDHIASFTSMILLLVHSKTE
jgi:hypothetical protein